MSDKLYVVYGAGNDAVGLVERITTAVAGAGGNIIDLRQDALHGLFTVYLVTQIDTGLEEFQQLVKRVGEDTGLDLHACRYVPVPKSGETRSLLVALLGRDKPGIVSAVSKELSAHKINIEFSRMIAREGIFLMELLTDVTHSSLPAENLENTVRQRMAAMGITCTFQQRDVFNPKKRIVLFDIRGSLIAKAQLDEVMQQAGLAGLEQGQLEGLPQEALERIVKSLQVTLESVELTRTLKRMGYRVALLTHAFAPVAEFAREHLGLDYAYGVELQADEDSQTLTGRSTPPEVLEHIVARLTQAEKVDRSDVLVLSDDPGDATPPGLRLNLDTRLMLEFLNQHVLSQETLSAVLAGFGRPR